MSTDIDPREYLALEAVLVRNVQKEWAKQAKVIIPPIQAAIDRKDWAYAFQLAQDIDLSDIGQKHKDLAYSVFRGCIDFGSQMATTGRSLMSSLAFSDVVKNVVNQWLQQIEWSVTQQMQKSAMQLIADAQAAEPYPVVKKADPIRPFVSFREDGDKLLQMISGLHTNRLSSWGFIAESDMRGLTTYRLNAMLDNRTSEFCRMIHGKTFVIEDARPIIEQGIHADDPNSLREIHPWPNQSRASIETYAGMTTDELVANKLHVPPFHPYCRTMMVKVSRQPRLAKPPAAESPGIDEFISNEQTFSALGIKLSPEQVELWNDYVTLNPVDVFTRLSGGSIADVLDRTVASSVKVTDAGMIKIGVKGRQDEMRFTGSLVLDVFAGLLYLSKVGVTGATESAAAKFNKGFLGAAKEIGTAVSAETMVMPVSRGEAVMALRDGFVPSPVDWQSIRLKLIERVEGPLNESFDKLPKSTQTEVWRILNNNNETAMLSLLKIGLPTSLLASLLRETYYQGNFAL